MQALEELPKRLGMKKKEVAELLGISPTHYSALISGREKPSTTIKNSVDRMMKGLDRPPISEQTKRMIELFEALPEHSKKDILYHLKTETRIIELEQLLEIKKAA